MKRDENDRLKDGTLPNDPGDDSRVVSADVPRVLTVRDLTEGALLRATTTARGGGCTSGHYKIDQITGGLKPGFVWVVGASTSWGKSSLLVMVADENLKLGKRVLIVSAEDSEHVYGDRLMARRARVSADNMRRGNLTSEERDRMQEVVRCAEDAPVFLDARGKPIEWLAPRIKRLIVEHNIDVVAYDYLQAFDNQERQQDRRNQITYIARVLTDTAKTARPGGIAGILFSQITEDKTKAHPDKNSIRESRDVSNAAEVVLLGFTPTKPIDDKDGRPLVAADQRCIFVDKCKDGPRGALLPLDWDENSACFNTTEDPDITRFREAGGDQFDDFGESYGGNYQ
jgi:replicative DNA helicase